MFILSIIKSKVNYSMTFKVNYASSSSCATTQATGHHLKPLKFNVVEGLFLMPCIIITISNPFYGAFSHDKTARETIIRGDPLSDLNGRVGKLIYLSIIVFFSLSYVVQN